MEILRSLKPKYLKEFYRYIRNFKYEITDDGDILLPIKAIIGGYFVTDVNGENEDWSKNVVTNEGLDDVLDVYLHNSTQTSTWYVSVFEGNVTPAATWTGANYVSNATEVSTPGDVDDGSGGSVTRQEYEEAAASSQSTDNLSNKASFTVSNAGGITLYGGALLSVSTIGGTTGVCFASSKFSSSRALADNDVINIGYTIAIASA